VQVKHDLATIGTAESATFVMPAALLAHVLLLLLLLLQA
jgi:hypothetical protein